MVVRDEKDPYHPVAVAACTHLVVVCDEKDPYHTVLVVAYAHQVAVRDEKDPYHQIVVVAACAHQVVVHGEVEVDGHNIHHHEVSFSDLYHQKWTAYREAVQGVVYRVHFRARHHTDFYQKMEFYQTLFSADRYRPKVFYQLEVAFYRSLI